MNEPRISPCQVVRCRLQGIDLTYLTCLTLVAIASFLLLSVHLGFSQTATATLNPEADTFVRSAAPFANYGGAGAIAVSGPTAVNGSNQQKEGLAVSCAFRSATS